MLDHRLRRWPNVKPALGQYVVFAGIVQMQFNILMFETAATV